LHFDTCEEEKKKKKGKKREKKEGYRRADDVNNIPAEGAARATKHARVVWMPFPKRFHAGDDVHFEISLSERQARFVESDEEGPVYIVPRNDGTQVYIARHLACHHTVRKLSYGEGYLATLSPNRPVRYYCPHEDGFFIVLNREESMAPLTGTFPFEELRNYSVADSLVGAAQVQRQSAKVNIGFTSSMSMATRAKNGVPVPTLKQCPLDNVVTLL
jgi:hypothetical protein